MRIKSADITQVLYFVAVDATDLTTRKTGLSSFIVYRSRGGGTATVMTTPTVTELSAGNMPGVYKLLCNQDMTITSGKGSEEMVYHITAPTMAPVTRAIELYEPANDAPSANVTKWAGTTVPAPAVTGVPKVDVTYCTGSAQATIATPTNVKDKVVEALATDTYAEPGQEAPPSTTTLVKKIGYLFKMMKNKKTQTDDTFKLFADDGTTVDQKSTKTDDDTTTTLGELGTGP